MSKATRKQPGIIHSVAEVQCHRCRGTWETATTKGELVRALVKQGWRQRRGFWRCGFCLANPFGLAQDEYPVGTFNGQRCRYVADRGRGKFEMLYHDEIDRLRSVVKRQRWGPLEMWEGGRPDDERMVTTPGATETVIPLPALSGGEDFTFVMIIGFDDIDEDIREDYRSGKA